jgi:hypothetical protein
MTTPTPIAIDGLTATAPRQLPLSVRGRVRRVGADYRLEGELRLIAIDLLGVARADELPLAMASWVQTATGAAVAAVRDATLAALVEAIDAQLASAPADVVRRLGDAASRHDAGII